MAKSDSMSNSDILKQEKEAFSNVRLPLSREDDLGGGELPFIVGVIDDISGNKPAKPKPELEERRFEKVTRYTLDTKMAEVGPGLEYDVKSTLPKELGGTGDTAHVTLRFNSMKDFEPKNVAEQIAPLNKLLRLRETLVNLRQRAAADPELRKELDKLVRELSGQES